AAVALMAPAQTPMAAQMFEADDTVVVEVPFDFVAGDKKMPAGTYRVEAVPAQAEGNVPMLVTIQTAARADDSEELIFHSLSTKKVDVDESGPTEDPKLVFTKVGGLYFLEQVEVS